MHDGFFLKGRWECKCIFPHSPFFHFCCFCAFFQQLFLFFGDFFPSTFCQGIFFLIFLAFCIFWVFEISYFTFLIFGIFYHLRNSRSSRIHCLYSIYSPITLEICFFHPSKQITPSLKIFDDPRSFSSIQGTVQKSWVLIHVLLKILFLETNSLRKTHIYCVPNPPMTRSFYRRGATNNQFRDGNERTNQALFIFPKKMRVRSSILNPQYRACDLTYTPWFWYLQYCCGTGFLFFLHWLLFGGGPNRASAEFVSALWGKNYKVEFSKSFWIEIYQTPLLIYAPAATANLRGVRNGSVVQGFSWRLWILYLEVGPGFQPSPKAEGRAVVSPRKKIWSSQMRPYKNHNGGT